MISLVVCSINENFLSDLKENVSRSIGVEFEWLIWDNRDARKGICHVYNMMAEKAKYDLICFMHEDILFQTPEWGRKLQAIFESEPLTGAVGLAGSKYKSASFSGWYTGIKELDCSNIIHLTDGEYQKVVLKPTSSTGPEQVVCLDGVLICVKKILWRENKFDDLNLHGFHFYDIDFSLRIAKHCKLYVVYDIDVVHITSGGDFGNPWITTAINYHLDHKAALPVSCVENSVNHKNYDHKIKRTWLDVLKYFPIRAALKFKWIFKQGLWRKPAYYYGIMKFLLYYPLGLRAIHKKKKS